MGLEELGVDSLMATEVLREINSKFAITLRMEELLGCSDLAALAAKVGTSKEELEGSRPESVSDADLFDLDGFVQTFAGCKGDFDTFAREAEALGFWEDVYPRQNELAVAYILQTFQVLGCDVRQLPAGSDVPQPSLDLPQHDKLVKRFLGFLRETGIIEAGGEDKFVRTPQGHQQDVRGFPFGGAPSRPPGTC